MIVSRKHNFIFVKTRKVAGTSVEIALSPHCGADDILSPITPADELLRYRAGALPRNFCNDPAAEDAYRAAIASGDVEKVIAARRAFEKHLVYWNHMPARAIRTAIGRTFWDRAFKFTIDRHPYEYVVSLVYFLSKSGTPLSRARKLLRTLVRVPTNRQLYSDGNEIIVDRVLRYENLAEELRAIAPMIGMDISGDLPKAKAGIRPQDTSPGRSLSELERRFIRFRWRREFKLFGYEP